jgi:hypothetical protein
VRVLEVRRRLDLGQEPVGADDGRELRLEHLEGDPALVADVVGQVHRGHAALTDLALDQVSAFESRVQSTDGI